MRGHKVAQVGPVPSARSPVPHMTVDGRDDVDVGASVASTDDLNTKVVVRQARHRLINTIAQKRNREGGARGSGLL